MANVEMLQRVLAQITEHPETHNQNTWESRCGTTRCVAGWAIYFASVDAGVPAQGVTLSVRVRGVFGPGDGSFQHAARTILRLDWETSEELFHYATDDETVVLIQNLIAENTL
jgi:hypothetical protein